MKNSSNGIISEIKYGHPMQKKNTTKNTTDKIFSPNGLVSSKTMAPAGQSDAELRQSDMF